MSHNRFNTSNIMAMAGIRLAMDPNAAEILQKLEMLQKADKENQTKIFEQNKQMQQKFLAQAPRHQQKHESKQQAHHQHQPRGFRK
jgi:hypothetical protein